MSRGKIFVPFGRYMLLDFLCIFSFLLVRTGLSLQLTYEPLLYIFQRSKNLITFGIIMGDL